VTPVNTPKSYIEAHRNVYKARGKASLYICIKCGEQAREWALLRHVLEAGMTWSADPMDYQPMCSPCHFTYDNDEDRIRASRDKARETFLEHKQSDPEFASRITEFRRSFGKRIGSVGGRALVAKSKSDPETAAKVSADRTKAGIVGARAFVDRFDEDPELREEYSRRMKDIAQRRRKCDICGKVSSPGGIGKHQKDSGHCGYVDIDPSDAEVHKL
jgi:hypothetical protein